MGFIQGSLDFPFKGAAYHALGLGSSDHQNMRVMDQCGWWRMMAPWISQEENKLRFKGTMRKVPVKGNLLLICSCFLKRVGEFRGLLKLLVAPLLYLKGGSLTSYTHFLVLVDVERVSWRNVRANVMSTIGEGPLLWYDFYWYSTCDWRDVRHKDLGYSNPDFFFFGPFADLSFGALGSKLEFDPCI